ncbi:MAG: hypothetical protein GC160_19845 [Acidobacteria bacterium]|nr:hypothetical protein [Acidobacteriota bacterium]
MTLILLLLAIQVTFSAFDAVRNFRVNRARWEYQIASVPDESWSETMKVAGDNGWDLVFARRAVGKDDTAAYEMIFRRPTPAE